VTERGWLTPNTGATEWVCRSINVPLDDQLQLLAAVNGALAELTKEHNWTAFGNMTPAETAELMFSIYEDYVVSDCVGTCICEVPADPSLGIEINIRIIRRGAGGHTEELVDGEWVTPTGDYEVPPIPERDEPTADERICLASANAVNVLETIYEEVTDAWSAEHTTAALFGALYDAAILLIGLFAGPTAAAYASLGKTAFDTFVETVDALAADVWTAAFTDELICFMKNYATDTAGVVTFDFVNMREAIFDEFLANAFDPDRALLWAQVAYLFDILAAGGIDTAGSTTAITTYDCSACVEEWCYAFDFSVNNGGWAVTPSTGGGSWGDALYANNGATFGTHVAGSYWAGEFKDWSFTTTDFRQGVDIRIQFPAAAHVDNVLVFYDKVNGSLSLTNTDSVRCSNAFLASRSASSAPAGMQTWSVNVNVDVLSTDYLQLAMTNHRDFNSPYVNSGYIRILGVEVRGTGPNPFGTDSCSP